MAFQIFWKIKFKSLRAGTNYTVNIYKDGTLPSGYPLTLKGGAQPFTTQEDDSDDMFTPIRTQTGYLRIVDDGKAEKANGTEISNWNWKELLPSTDTDRPITLTDGSGNVVWQGFMQAQNFGGTLYGNPQEREFPVQCPLTILEGTDINYQHTAIENFAYLLQRIVNTIDVESGGTETSGVITTSGNIHINRIYVQGSADAQAWLLKRIDWQNFCDIDGDGAMIARYNLYQILEDVCRFWGWTARTHGQDMYLTCADDSAEQTWLTMTRAQLDTMAGGSSAGTTGGAFSTVTLSGDIFANTSQDDYQLRGPNKALVTADTNSGDEDVIKSLNDEIVKQMEDLGYQTSYKDYDGKRVTYTNDLLTISQPYLSVSCREGYASLNIGKIVVVGSNQDPEFVNVIRIKKTGSNSATPMVSMETAFEHCFNDGFLRLFGQTYRFTTEYKDPFDPFDIGRSYMYARIAIGKSKSNAMWWNGRTWQSSQTYCRLSIGNNPNRLDNNLNEFFFLYLQETQASSDDWGCNILPLSGLQGKLFIDLLGTSNTRVSQIDNQRSFELKDFRVEFLRNPGVTKFYSASDNVRITDVDRPTQFGYKNTNSNKVREEWNADCIYATENACKFGYGELINPNGTFVENVGYGQNQERPEQHLANRVAAYWAASKRKLSLELRRDQISAVTPMNKTSVDGTTGYPVAINHDWRDDITQLTIIEL